MSLPQRFAQVFGAIYLLVGILGFVPVVPLLVPAELGVIGPLEGFQLGLFAVNWLHSLTHLAIGAAGLALYRSRAGARSYALAEPRRGAVLRAGDRGALPGALLAGARPAHRIWSRAALRGAGPAAAPGHGDDRLRGLLLRLVAGDCREGHLDRVGHSSRYAGPRPYGLGPVVVKGTPALSADLLRRIRDRVASLCEPTQKKKENMTETNTGLHEGQQMPAFELPDEEGRPFNLSEQLEEGPFVLVFYRGDW